MSGWDDSEQSMIEQAWGLIANVLDWDGQTPGWRENAEDWRERYHRYIRTDASRNRPVRPPTESGKEEV